MSLTAEAHQPDSAGTGPWLPSAWVGRICRVFLSGQRAQFRVPLWTV